MLDSAPPLEQEPPWPGAPPNVLSTMYTGRPCDWLSARMPAPPRSGPVGSHTLRKKREFTTLNRPPRTKMAPPPPPSVASPVELPSTKVRFWTVRRGWSWSWQCEVVWTWAASQVFMYRIRRRPPPLSVTFPPPSMTMSGPVSLRILAVASSVIVTGSGPQSKVRTPPAATASTTAADVQLAGVPVPMTLSGWDVSAGPASAGTPAPPAGVPAAGPARSGGGGRGSGRCRRGGIGGGQQRGGRRVGDERRGGVRRRGRVEGAVVGCTARDDQKQRQAQRKQPRPPASLHSCDDSRRIAARVP